MSRVKFNDKQQADLTEMQALADSSEDNSFELTKLLLFSTDYRVDGALAIEDGPISGVVKIDPGVFVKADGKFYKLTATATANIITGVEDQPANVWGTGLAADGALPRKSIVVVSHQFIEDTAAIKNFIDDSVIPPVQFTQNVTTRKQSAPIFSILHGTPSATPTEPAVPSGFMKIVTIDVPALATTVVEANITNNLNVNILSLEKLQQASQASSAFSDILHSDGVYAGVLSELEVVETSPQSLAVSASTGNALRDGVSARIATSTTVPIDAGSFSAIVDEVIDFSGGDTQVLQTNGTPPHKIRPATVVVTGGGGAPSYTEAVDYTIDYAAGEITRLGGGSIPGGGSVEVDYQYFLPRIDRIELLMSNSTPQSILGTPAQSPVAPAASPNTLTLAYVAVGEGVAVITDADITDTRVFLPDMDELIASRAAFDSLTLRLADMTTKDSDAASHAATNITPSVAAHGIQQGTGNGFDADTVDGDEAAALKARANHSGTQAPATITPQGVGSGLDADTIDGIHANATPTANQLVPLDGSAQFPTSVIPGGLLPSGITSPYAGATAPAGWRVCNGEAISRTTYASLFTAIGVIWGAGDGATTFNLPDMRGLFARGRTGFSSKNFAPGDITIGTENINITAHGLNRSGFKIRFTTNGTLPTGLAINTTYYAIWIDADNFKVASTHTNALSGTPIDLTATGSGTHTLEQWVDADSASRPAIAPGGASGDDVGSFQEQADLPHTHSSNNGGHSGGDSGTAIFGATTSITTTNAASESPNNEVRPKNAYFMHIIKL